MIGVHCPGFEASHGEQAVRDAVARLGIAHPVLIDSELEVWQEYENVGWPARYLFDGRARLFDYHFGEGGYAETELAIQELLDVRREPLAPLRPEDAPGAMLAPQTQDQQGAYCGPYEAGGVWAVLDGAGTVTVNGGDGRGAGAGGHAPRGVPAARARAPHRGRAGSADRAGRQVPGDVLHAGDRALEPPRLAMLRATALRAVLQQAHDRRRTVVLDEHARPRPVGALAGAPARNTLA